MKKHTRTPADAMPAFVEPCLATLTATPPEGDLWVHEIKFDGYRMQARLLDGKVQLLTRRGLDWTARFAHVAKALARLKVKSAILDGEIVVEDDHGRSSFVDLVNALKAGESAGMRLMAFDLLYLEGHDVREAKLLERKALLETLLGSIRANSSLRYSQHILGSGRKMLTEVCKLGLEGIISKRTDKPYRSGRRDDWLKEKCHQTDEFVIGGYVDSTAMKTAIGALVLGYYERGKFIYAGRVGTGFSHRAARELWTVLQPHRTQSSPFSSPLDNVQRKGVTFVKPVLVAQIEYRGWTADSLLRQAAFLALREDVDPAAVKRVSAKAEPGNGNPH